MFSIFSIGLKFLGWWIERSNATAKDREAYYNFIEIFQKSQGVPSEIKQSYDEQIKEVTESYQKKDIEG